MPMVKNCEWKIKNYFTFIKIASLLNSSISHILILFELK
jgi:hypothetical protein